jgi:hypothetical protein
MMATDEGGILRRTRYWEHLRGHRGSNRLRMHNCLIICGSAAGICTASVSGKSRCPLPDDIPQLGIVLSYKTAMRVRCLAYRNPTVAYREPIRRCGKENGLHVVATAALLKNYIYYKWPPNPSGIQRCGLLVSWRRTAVSFVDTCLRCTRD